MANPTFKQITECSIYQLIKAGDTSLLQGQIELMFENKTDGNHRKEKLSKFLIQACRYKHVDIIRYLLKEHNADPNTTMTFYIYDYKVKDTILCWACFNQDFDIIKVLVNAGADVNLAISGLYPLHYVCFKHVPTLQDISLIRKKEKSKIIHFLINSGANVNSRTETGKTPLMFACEGLFFRDASYRVFLLANIDINAVDDEANTALHLHLKNSENVNPSLVKCFLQKGADANARNIHKQSPIDVLIERMVSSESEVSLMHNLLAIFIEHSNLSERNKIMLLDIKGASIVRQPSPGGFDATIECWQQACNIKSKMRSVKSTCPDELCCGFTEIETAEELEALSQTDTEMIIFQGILRVYKYLGLNHILTLKLFFHLITLHVANGQFERGFRVFRDALLYILLHNDIDTEDDRLNVLSCLIAQWFKIMKGLPYRDSLHTSKIFEAFVDHLEKLKRNQNFSQTINYAWNLYHFVVYFKNESDELGSPAAVKCLTKFSYFDLRFGGVCCGGNFLHLVVQRHMYTKDKNITYVVKMLLKSGMSANVQNTHGNTPLSYLLFKGRSLWLEHDHDLLFALADDTHLDIRNRKGMTALQYLVDNKFPIYPLKYVSLKCLAAAVIRNENIEYESFIPTSLKRFVEVH